MSTARASTRWCSPTVTRCRSASTAWCSSPATGERDAHRTAVAPCQPLSGEPRERTDQAMLRSAPGGATGRGTTTADRKLMSIGTVLNALRDEFPEVTISKIRFLETEGLVEPQRTPSGYRKFGPED